MGYRDMHTVHSNKFGVDIDYYLGDGSFHIDDEGQEIETTWGCSADDDRGYVLTFIDGEYYDGLTEVDE